MQAGFNSNLYAVELSEKLEKVGNKSSSASMKKRSLQVKKELLRTNLEMLETSQQQKEVLDHLESLFKVGFQQETAAIKHMQKQLQDRKLLTHQEAAQAWGQAVSQKNRSSNVTIADEKSGTQSTASFRQMFKKRLLARKQPSLPQTPKGGDGKSVVVDSKDNKTPSFRRNLSSSTQSSSVEEERGRGRTRDRDINGSRSQRERAPSREPATKGVDRKRNRSLSPQLTTMTEERGRSRTREADTGRSRSQRERAPSREPATKKVGRRHNAKDRSVSSDQKDTFSFGSFMTPRAGKHDAPKRTHQRAVLPRGLPISMPADKSKKATGQMSSYEWKMLNPKVRSQSAAQRKQTTMQGHNHYLDSSKNRQYNTPQSKEAYALDLYNSIQSYNPADGGSYSRKLKHQQRKDVFGSSSKRKFKRNLSSFVKEQEQILDSISRNNRGYSI